jgi:hypothetical protein
LIEIKDTYHPDGCAVPVEPLISRFDTQHDAVWPVPMRRVWEEGKAAGFEHGLAALLFELYGLRNSSGSLAMLAAMRRASSLVGCLPKRLVLERFAQRPSGRPQTNIVKLWRGSAICKAASV